ncbi:gastric triacylglycerol lipase-like [Trifolium pratense]|uniref:gastric triacylglycerol lipase-like n=1 Tax=Trifolium pratense TaxID=57577 RepID=UPI001E69160B|nr:gastric triacylglycerol lipase-like [Trifolium pratense]
MIQQLVDHVLAVIKESVKAITTESLNSIIRIINGVSALLLALLPGNAKILEGIHGWELRPTFRGPRLPRWMENGASSFNQFIYELSVDSDNSSFEYSSSGEEDSDRCECPPSPASYSSRASDAAYTKFNRHQMNWIQYILLWILLPIKFMLRIPLRLLRLSYFVVSKALHVSREKRPPHLHAYKRVQSLKEHFIHRATDRRRGVVEDLHLGIEICIESIFDVLHKTAHLVLSPSKAFGALFSLFSSHGNGVKESRNSVEDAPTEKITNYESLNTDARTCQDVITDLGYPYEAIKVITADGYIILLERIPRRDARKAVFLQHGVFDSSMGWVSNGVVGSPAFAAYDQGYDVYLGNFRGLVSREHVNKNISSRQYWKYSVNEHGTEDIPAMIEKIHQVKTAELKLSTPDTEDKIDGDQPYKLCAISHSLGGAAMIMYIVTRRIEEKSHRLSRLVLLSPAGFHDDSNIVFSAAEILLSIMAPILSRVVPAFYIPTRFFRMLVFKLARDLHNLPAVGGLVQTLMSYVVGGDSSNWVGVLGLPHYNMNDMPGVSFRVALHLAQIKRVGRFRMFNYGSASANRKAYGSPEPLDLGEHYGLIDIPVDLVAGHKDKVIRPSMVKRHYRLMKNAGLNVSYNQFEYAHLDFTFSHREELLSYVMSRLLLVDPNSKHQANQMVAKSERNKQGEASK